MRTKSTIASASASASAQQPIQRNLKYEIKRNFYCLFRKNASQFQNKPKLLLPVVIFLCICIVVFAMACMYAISESQCRPLNKNRRHLFVNMDWHRRPTMWIPWLCVKCMFKRTIWILFNFAEIPFHIPDEWTIPQNDMQKKGYYNGKGICQWPPEKQNYFRQKNVLAKEIEHVAN